MLNLFNSMTHTQNR